MQENVLSPKVRRVGRRAVVMLMSAALLAAGLVNASGLQSAHADTVLAQPGELVINGGGEQPVSIGWTGSLGRATHGVGGYPASVIVDSNGPTGETYPGGTSMLTGSGAASVATQTIDLTPSAAAIDNGSVDALLSVYIGGYATQRDNAQVTYDFFDAAGTKVAGALFGPVLPADRGSISGFVPFAETVRLPAGARSAVITITTQRFVAPANDAYIDNVSLILDAPSPTAAPDRASTVQNVPIAVSPPENDTPGTGAELVRSSLRLLNGDVEVTTLATAEGTFTVNPETGEVEFVPNADFVGTTAPVPYRIRDNSGQQAESTITIDVVAAAPSIVLVKAATPSDPAQYVVGTEITYSFSVTNTGNVTVDEIAISEDAFTGAGDTPTATCPAAPLEPSEQVVCTASYTLVQEDIDNRGISNTATASGSTVNLGTPVSSDPSTAKIPVEASPSLSLVKTADPKGADSAEDNIVYSFNVTNTGNVTLSSVSISEEAFSGFGNQPTVTCPEGNLIPGATVICAANYVLTQADVDAGTVSNTAVAQALYGEEFVESESSTALVTVAQQPALLLEKTTPATAVTGEGEVVDYNFRVSNTGNMTLTNIAIQETDFTGAGELDEIKCPATPIAPGEYLDCTVSYVVTTDDMDESVLSNSATASATAGAASLTSSVSTAMVPIDVPTPGLILAKSATPTDPAAFIVGADIMYTFVVTNNGNVPISDITITEESFTGAGKLPTVVCPGDTVDPGTQMNCTASYTLVQADIDNGGVTNTATVTGTPDGFDSPISSEPSTATTPAAAKPAMTLVKTADATNATDTGDQIRYTFVVTNTGNVTLDAVSITEESFTGAGETPSIACPDGDLAPGEVTTCTADYILTQPDIDTGTVSNTALANVTYEGDIVSSEPSTALVTIPPRPAMAFTKTTTTDGVTEAGQVIDYIFRVSNTGNVTLMDVTISDSNFSGAAELGEIICPQTTITPGEEIACTVRYTVVDADLQASYLSNSASATARAGDNTLASTISTVLIPIDRTSTEPSPGDEEPSPGDEEPSPGDEEPSPGDEDEDPGQAITQPDQLPNTGGTVDVTLLAAGTIVLLLGATLLLLARRRQEGNEAGATTTS